MEVKKDLFEGVDVKLVISGGKAQIILEGDAKLLLEKLKVAIPGTIDDMIISIIETQIP